MTLANTRNPRSMAADDLLRVAEQHGFALVRSGGGHRIIKRGQLTFTLNTTGQASAWLTQTVLNACREIELHPSYEERRRARQAADYLPLMLEWKGQQYSVISQSKTQYRVRSVDDGMIWHAPKEEVKELTLDEIAEQQAAAQAAMPPAEPTSNGSTPPPAPVQPVDPRLAEIDPMAYWLETTNRAIQRMEVELAQLENRAAPLRQKLAALTQARDTVTGSATRVVRLGHAPPAPRKSAGARGTKKDPELKERVKQELLKRKRATGYQREVATLLNINSVTISGWVKKWRDEGIDI